MTDGTQCDLCGKETSNLSAPASMLKDIDNLEWMCNDCMLRLNAKLTEVRKVVHKQISDAMIAEAELIRSEHK